MKIMNIKYVVIIAIFSIFFGAINNFSYSMTQTLKKEPAIVIVAFGTTTEAEVTYHFFEEQLREELPKKYKNLKILWAFTSEIVREKMNKRFKKKGINKRYLSLEQALSNLKDEGYTKIAVQSLHVFPGQEYYQMQKTIEVFKHLGLRISYGGSLLHKWDMVFETINILEKEFLKPQQGCNVIVAHGTPLSFHPDNLTYLGLDRYLSEKYTNVFIGTVEGILTREQVLKKAKACKHRKVKLIPFMYVAGDHIINDIMGNKPDEEGFPSWSMELQDAGIKVSSVYVFYKGKKYFKGLGFYKEINRIFIKQLIKSLDQLEES